MAKLKQWRRSFRLL